MPIKWNEVTWYSKLLAVILFVLVFFLGFYLGEQKKETETTNIIVQQKESPAPKTPAVTIKNKDIKEEYFTGSVPAISGSDKIAALAQAYIDQTVSDFKTQADQDVPGMIREFGAGSPPAHYEIDITASYIKGAKTESIAMTVYTYTGGAHGVSNYKVITTTIGSGKALSLGNVIKGNQEQNAFTALMKEQLNTWVPEGSTAPVVFPDEVNALTFSSFANWSLDSKNLTIYFDQYAIGPGALGEVAFPLSLDKIKSFVDLSSI